MVAALPKFPILEDLAVANIQEPVSLGRDLLTGIVRLFLVGDYDAISQMKGSELDLVKSLSFDFTSTSPHQRAAREASIFPSLRADTDLSFSPNDSWTNQSLSDAICNSFSPYVTSLFLSVPSTTVNWYTLPSCIYSWTNVTSVMCSRCKFPDMSFLPPTTRTLSIQRTKEQITDFAWEWISNLPQLTTLVLSFNQFGGTLPNHLSHSNMGTFNVLGNQLTGTISPDWMQRYPALMQLTLSQNKLSGTIPNYGFAGLNSLYLSLNAFTHWPDLIINATYPAPTALYTIELNGNALVEIPSEASFQTMSSLTAFSIQTNPGLSGRSFPNIFATTTPRTSSTYVQNIFAYECGFTGALPEIPATQISLYSSVSTFSFYSNQFTGSIPASWSGITFRSSLDLSGNALTGTLAQMDANGKITSQSIKDATTLNLGGNGFTGPMFNLSTMPSLTTLSMAAAFDVDFCSSAGSTTGAFLYPSDSLTTCTLTSTNASSCYSAYPLACRPAVPPASSPVTICPLPSPGPTFQCLSTGWTSVGSVSEPKITLPPSSSTVVNGNLTTSNIVINSASTTVNVTGCVSSTNGTELSISVTLTQADLDEIMKGGGKLSTLFVLQSASCAPISGATLNIDTSGIKSCRTISTDKIGTSTGIGATFTIRSSRCNVWWIVLVSVLCGVVVIAVIVVIFLLSCSKAFRHKIRPFSKPRGPDGI